MRFIVELPDELFHAASTPLAPAASADRESSTGEAADGMALAGAAYDGGPVIIVDPIPYPICPEHAPNPAPFPRGPIGYLP
jgi:hypothetical protein